jgi:hypothetical protein
MMGAEVIDAKARSVLGSFNWHDSPPALAKSVNIDLAIANCYKLTYRQMPQTVKDAYDAAMLLISDIGTNSAWEDTNQPLSKTASSIKWFTPNTPTTGTLATRMSHSVDTDWL